MGIDIHMHIVKDEKYIKKNIFDGRNREWFNNLMDEGWDDCYDHLDIIYGLSPDAPKDLDVEKMRKDGYFNFFHVRVKRFKEWFIKYRPDVDAGWVNTYDKWRIENKGYIPEDAPHYLPEDARIGDWYFVEFTNKWDCSSWLYHYLIDNKIDDDADITYWFDN